MKYLLVLLLVVSCAQNERRVRNKSVSQIKNEDFIQEPPVPFNRNKDFYSVDDIDQIMNDSLVEETIQRVPEPQRERIAESKNDISRFTSLCYSKDFDKAFNIIDRLYSRYKKHPGFWNQVGSCHYLKNDLRKARLFYQKTIELNAKYAPAFNNIGAVHIKNKDYEKALAAFKKAKALSRFSLTPTYNLAKLYLSFGVINQAQKFFNAIESQRPGDFGVMNGLATTYLYQGKLRSALTYYRKIKPNLYRRPEFGINYAVALKLAGDSGRAASVLSDVKVTRGWSEYYGQVQRLVGN